MTLAGDVNALLLKDENSYHDIFTALTLCMASMAVDYCVDEAGNVDEDRLDNTVAELNSQTYKAAVFAVQQIKDNPKIITVEEFNQTNV